jgi:hypothetical protein
MKMKSERPLLVNGAPQTEFETSDQHGKELIAKGLAVEVGAKLAKSTEPAVPASHAAVDAVSTETPAPTTLAALAAPPAAAKAGKPKNS